MKPGSVKELVLGNLNRTRDWGTLASMSRPCDDVRALSSGRFVIATGESHPVRELCQVAFGHVGHESNQWSKIDPKLVRPVDVKP